MGEATWRATDFVAKYILGGGDKSRLHEEVAAIVANPTAFVEDPLRGELAKALISNLAHETSNPHLTLTLSPPIRMGAEREQVADANSRSNAFPNVRKTPISYRQWGEGLEHEAVMQMENGPRRRAPGRLITLLIRCPL